MKHDPFYQQIVDRLKRTLDPDAFEECATDLLRDEWPTLVPVRGGTDGGMDGAVADGDGLPFPLICTTSKAVIGNLTKNLDTYIAKGGVRRRVILATSQFLTPKRRRNLEDRAREKGFALIQIYDQDAIAQRLYRNPNWCLELLGLTGNPPALSVIPLGRRSVPNLSLIGRAEDLAWLLQTPGDRLLVGVPGSGKTFLLEQYAREAEGLFVVSEDRGAIAAALRSQEPRRIIVDDAHLNLDRLDSLKHLRREVGAEFEIVACCWPGERDKVFEKLQPDGLRDRELALLTRDEIVQIVTAAGLQGPTALIREIVDQAEGRPGLAVTLARLCLQGGVEKVVLGTALSRSVRTTFERLIGNRSTSVLAVLSLGGAAGMLLGTVAEHLGYPLGDVHRTIAELATGGVITEVPLHRSLAIRPPALGEVLVRDYFFAGPAPLPLEPLLPEVIDLRATISTMIGARRRGGAVEFQRLAALLEEAGTPDLWDEFAWLGTTESIHVLTRHPELLLTVAEGALYHAPERAIPLLLQSAIGDQRSLNSHPEHPLRRLETWVQQAFPGSDDGLHRRRTMLAAVGGWLASGGTPRAIQFSERPAEGAPPAPQ